MKKKSSRIVALVLTLCMVFFGLPVTAMAEGVSDENALRQAVAAGGTVTLAGNITVTGDSTLSVSDGVSVVLDLGGHTLSLNNAGTVSDSAYKAGYTTAEILNAGSLSIKNGCIEGSAASVTMIANQGDAASLVLADDVDLVKTSGNAIDNLGGTITSSADITVSGSNSSAIVTYGGNVNIKSGTLKADYGMDIFNRLHNNTSAGAEVVIDGGSISAKKYALSTNNLYSGGNTPSNVTVNGGTLASSNATAIYWPTSGTLTIGKENASAQDVSITASSGSAIEICSGTLVVNGGTLSGSDSNDALNSSATWASRYRVTQNGCAGLGDAVTIIARRGNPYATAPLSVTINNGVFSSSDNYAVRYFDCNQVKNAAVVSQNVEVNIKGGSFTGSTAGAVDAALVAANEQKFITGGTFSTNVSDYVSSGYTSTYYNGKWSVEESAPVASIARTSATYNSLVEAVAAAENGDTITLLKNASGSGIGTFKGDEKYPVKNFTIDFAGFTYTCTGPAVGSSGTESQAFHLEWNGNAENNVNVTLKNGTITSTAGSGVYMLVQNYCDLTIENMVLDGTNIGNGNYTSSNNCGNVTIKDSTIIAPQNGFAFDSCDYSSYTGVTVTVEGDSYIQGKIEVTNPNKDENKAHLYLKGGYFISNQVGVDSGSTADLADYVADGYTLTAGDVVGYDYMVVENEVYADGEVAPVVADPDVKPIEAAEDMTDEEKTALNTAAGTAEATGLTTACVEDAKEITGADVTAAKTQLMDAGVSVDNATVTLYVQAYLEITPKYYSEAKNILTLDITPMVQVVASTADIAEDIVLEEDVGAGKTKNAVVYRKPKPLTIANKNVTMTITLPNDFTTVATAYVLHAKSETKQYVYDGEVENDILTFINPNGFSDFTVYGADPSVARVEDGSGYMTLQEAVNAVKNNGTIVVKKTDSATVSKSITFTVKTEGGANATITAGGSYKESHQDNNDGSVTYTFSKKSSTSSDDGPSLGYRLPSVSETTGGKNFVSDTTSNLTVNGKYQFRITSTDGHKPVMTVSNSNFTVELASQSGNDYFYVIRCAGAAGSTANVLVDGYQVVVATVGTAGVVSDTTHPFTVAQGATYQFKLTSASRPTFTGNNANFTIAYVGNSGNDWFFKVTAVGAAGASTTFSANGVAVTTATIA